MQNRKYYFIIVNFNNSEISQACINSIFENRGEINVIVVDNASVEEEKYKLIKWLEKFEYSDRCTLLLSEKNLGYFGGLNYGLQYIDSFQNSFVVIGNNDLVYNADFTFELSKIKASSSLLLIAPNIYKRDGTHQNPYMQNRPSLFRRLSYRLFYSNYYIAFLLLFIVAKTKKRKKYTQIDDSTEIYCAHGSCLVLTEYFFTYSHQLENFCFLYGEEVTLAHQIRSYNGLIVYFPQLKVLHNEHSSIGKMCTKNRFRLLQQAYKKTKKFI
ncbi:glycosyltransferase family 2 protein [Bacteroides cellulosilyticus]|jgi:GT2 family glycosyltransferase|uniref:glycosyltransferase family 2 protein n=1 Tax=Bacteroides cellulosilyticus TaxID=246787 RepID=UPI00076016B8|nr:glycosyltransferase [Bacteroides cellulosilyticus]KWR58969.1 putative glycosyltransferase [Bacteroides cellulosilyticus]